MTSTFLWRDDSFLDASAQCRQVGIRHASGREQRVGAESAHRSITSNPSAYRHDKRPFHNLFLIIALEKEPGLPDVFALYGNYPNPFNPATTFRFDLPQSAYVTLTVYDAVGRAVATVVSEQLTAGSFRYTWEAGNLPSGVYFYRLDAESYTRTKKLVLLK